MEIQLDFPFFILENTWVKRYFNDIGWGNGYVICPNIEQLYSEYNNVNCHGGITYNKVQSGAEILQFSKPNNNSLKSLLEEDRFYYVLGFDTCHYSDCLSRCPQEYVLMETLRLKVQLEKIYAKYLYEESLKKS